MSEQLSATPVQPAIPSSPPVKLWTPRAVGNIAFFTSFPGGFVLAALNRLRMGLPNQAVNLLIIAAIQSVVFILLLLLLPGQAARALGLVVNIATAFYLNNLTQKDINAFKATNREIQYAHWFGGFLIGLVTFGGFLILAFIIIAILVFAGVPIPE